MNAKLLAAAGGIMTILALVVGLVAVGGAGSQSADAASTGIDVCATDGPLAGLSDVAAANARIVVATAERQGGSTGAVIALAVGITESGLRVLGNTDGQQGLRAVQGLGSDHDSIGFFQQRPSWGSAAQRLDPALSTGLFMARLFADHGWQSKHPWIAAQDVQVSAYDGNPRAANNDSAVYGGNYQAAVKQAQQIVAAVDKDAATLTCGGLGKSKAASVLPGSHGLPETYAVPATATAAESKAITFAIAQLDKPYGFGASGPDSFDCSGLMLAAWAQAGVTLPHYTVAQQQAGAASSPGSILPGDLVLVPGSDGTLAAPGHVGMYIGDGLVLDAADEKDGILVQAYDNFVQGGIGLSAIRHIA
jgi:cell wall-associated NlpC family hydrolase